MKKFCTLIILLQLQVFAAEDSTKALLKAVKDKDFTEVKRLATQLKSLDIKDENGYSLLIYAGKAGDFAIFKYLAEKGSPDLYGGIQAAANGLTPGHYSIIEYILQRKLDDPNRHEDLSYALKNACATLKRDPMKLKVIKLLLQNGADVNFMKHNEHGPDVATPLMAAAYFRDVDAVKLLVENGAIIEKKSGHNNTALLLAAAQGADEAVEYLLSKGANPNHVNNAKNTPLFVAVANYINATCETCEEEGKRRTRTIRTLLKNGADAKYKDKQGRGLLHWASTDEVEEMLKKAGATQ